MRKLLLSLAASSAIFYSINAQTKISFESTEGYNTGALSGQKTWTAWGGAPANFTTVSTAKASDGVRSVKISSDESVMDNYGIESTVQGYQKAVISYSINVEGLGGSDNFFVVYNDAYDVVAAVDFDYTGTVQVNDAESGLLETSKTYSANQWYNVKIEIDFTNSLVNYYVNSDLVGTGAINPEVSEFNIVDLMTDDYGTGFYVDNIQVVDATLAVAENAADKAFRVYPNPAVDVINFELNSKVISTEVYDAAGKSVKAISGDVKSVDVSSLPKGVYVVKVKTAAETFSKKVIKK